MISIIPYAGAYSLVVSVVLDDFLLGTEYYVTTTQFMSYSKCWASSTNQTIPHPPPATPKAKSKPNATSLVARYNVKAKASSLRRSRQRKYKIELAQLAVTWGRTEGYARGSLVLRDDPHPGL